MRNNGILQLFFILLKQTIYTTSVILTLKTSKLLSKFVLFFIVFICCLFMHEFELDMCTINKKMKQKNSRSSDIFATKNCCGTPPSLLAWLALLIYSCFQDSIIFRMFLKFRNNCFMPYKQFHEVSSNVAANSGRNPGHSPLTGKGTCLVWTTTNNTYVYISLLTQSKNFGYSLWCPEKATNPKRTDPEHR